MAKRTDKETVQPADSDNAAERPPWTPQADTPPDFNPFANIETAARSPGATLEHGGDGSTIRDPAVDTAPLQGTRDLSDADSLLDVIAAGTDGKRG